MNSNLNDGNELHLIFHGLKISTAPSRESLARVLVSHLRAPAFK
jgi:hypothetical protein